MSHEIYTNAVGKASMAYVGDEPWHGLGQKLSPSMPLETWAHEAGLDFYINESPVSFELPDHPGSIASDSKIYGSMPMRKVLYRNDTGAALSVVGSKYRVVQPLEVLEFFRNLTTEHGWQLETAGVLFQGAKYWALAKTGQEVRIMGQDLLQDYVLLATSCDGTLRTVAKRTSVRVVCNNTLSYAAPGEGIRVSHASTFNADAVKSELGLTDSWSAFSDQAIALAERKVSNKEAVQYVVRLFGDVSKPVAEQPAIKTISKVLQLFDGLGRGSDLVSAKSTAFGLVNAVTEYLDYHKGLDQSRRLDSSWFGAGDNLKQEAFNVALELLAA